MRHSTEDTASLPACHSPATMLDMISSAAECVGGTMNELIDRLVASTGIDKSIAEKAVGIILNFLLKEGPTDKVQGLVDKIPGAAALVAAEQANADSGGMFGGMGSLMGAGQSLMAAGLSMGEVQSVTREVVAYARETAGEDVVGEIVGAIPGLSQFA